MPYDDFGFRADAIFGGGSTINRMNPGRLYEHYVNRTSDWVTMQLRERSKTESWEPLFAELMRYYQTASPIMYEHTARLLTDPKRQQAHVEATLKDGIRLFLPPNSPNNGAQLIRDLKAAFPVPRSPVTYRGRSGRVVRTRAPIMIGSMYLIVLEKTGHDWAAVSASKRQHFGIPAKLTNTDKHAAPGREQPTRNFGESEIRWIVGACGGKTAADLLDQSTNPAAQRAMVDTLLQAENPSNIECILDRDRYPIGDGRALSMVKHILQMAGFKLAVYRGEQ